jgi:hypothetical protein
MRGALSSFLCVQKSENWSIRSPTSRTYGEFIKFIRMPCFDERDPSWTWMRFELRRRVLCHEAAGLRALTCSIEVLIESGSIGLMHFAEHMAACKADTGDPHCALSAHWLTKRCGGCCPEEPNTNKEPPTRPSWHFRWQRIRSVSSSSTPRTGSHWIGCSNQLGLHSRRRNQQPWYLC